jgi:hypothetical protein
MRFVSRDSPRNSIRDNEETTTQLFAAVCARSLCAAQQAFMNFRAEDVRQTTLT